MLERAAQRATLMWCRQEPPREALWRAGIVAGVVPVSAPFVDVFADVIQPVCVRRIPAHGFGPGAPATGVFRQRLRRRIAPGIELALESSAGSSLPIRLGGQAIRSAGHFAEPLAIGRGIKPGWRDHRLLGMIEV